MRNLKITKKVKTTEKNIGGFIAMLLFTLVIVITIGISFGIRNSSAQQQPSLLAYNSPSNNLHTFDPGNTRDHNAVTSSSQTFTKSKNLDLNHSFVSNEVVGPDRFRFVTSYWTTSDPSRGIDVGTSANNTFLSTNSLPPNQKLEVDTNEGFSTLAVVLQYQGVVDLAGITAALKLPAGFKAQYPLTDHRHNFNIALSSYRGHIYPSQGIVLYFSVNILPTAKVQVPVLGPLALHFLRTSQRSILDSIDASQQNMFA
ncbi:MAG: hypothetical protein WB988_11025, partial [Candidatus Nitrosopolaris sp.]